MISGLKNWMITKGYEAPRIFVGVRSAT